MKKAYKFSFVAGGLLLPETAAIAGRYLEQPDWEAIRREVEAGQLLRTTRSSSRSRYFLEIRRRFRVAAPFELAFIAGEADLSRLANFAVCCRYYQVLGDFMVDVVRDKLRLGDRSLGNIDFYAFFERQTQERPELEGLSDSTRVKVKTVLFRMLSEAGIFDPVTKIIAAPRLPEALVYAYQQAGDSDALVHLLAGEGK
jgi:hypothetical protein